MDDLTVSTSRTPQGLRTILLESETLRVVVLPEAGARIRQITYKPLDADLLWNHPTLPAKAHGLHSIYDDVWSGGWDELFPNDEAGALMGHALPDHGELWTGNWHAEPFQRDGVAGVHLRFITPISNFLAEKTLQLRPASDVLEIQYRLTNQGDRPFPFLWKLHPAFAVSPRHRIDFPPMSVLLEPEFPGTLDGAPPKFPWPHAPIDGTMLDLRRVPDVSSHAVHFFYGAELASGWCGVTNRANQLAAALRFDPKVFPSSWLFATHGGWRDLNVAVLEPATGYPFRMQPLIDGGRARTLARGESLKTTVLFSVQQGLTSIGGVEPDGRILPGEEN
jgi:hypothetical protein